MAKKLTSIPKEETERILAKVLEEALEQAARQGGGCLELAFKDTDLSEKIQQEGYVLEVSELVEFFEKIAERLNVKNPHFSARASRQYGNPSDRLSHPGISLYVGINRSAWGKLPSQVLVNPNCAKQAEIMQLVR